MDIVIHRVHIRFLATHEKVEIAKFLVWLTVVLGATPGCVILVKECVVYFISEPTATIISSIRHHTLTFPAVTVCNLNSFRSGILKERNLTRLLQLSVILTSLKRGERCEDILESVPQSSSLNVNYEELIVEARHHVEDFIQVCSFAGKPCGNITEVFEPIIINMRLCYTFNSGRLKPPVQSRVIGQRFGLQLIVNVNQSDYAMAFDEGVQVAVHQQSEPPLADDQGIAVPTGSHALIGIKERRIQDETKRNCTIPEDLSKLNFLQGENSTYSESACFVDCMLTSMADNCECIGARSFYSPDTARYSQLPNCTVKKACCIFNELFFRECNCPVVCSSISYDTSVSYSNFPAKCFSPLVASQTGIPEESIPKNILFISTFFDTLNVEMQTTRGVFSLGALLADIGGDVGLCLGLSAISILEFESWIIKMVRNLDLSKKLKKVKDHKCLFWRQKHSTAITLDEKSSPLL